MRLKEKEICCSTCGSWALRKDTKDMECSLCRPSPLLQILSKQYAAIRSHQQEFFDLFKVSLFKFHHLLFGFDIVKFDDWVHQQGYTEEKHGSLKQYLQKHYGEKAVQLIDSLIRGGKP